MTGQPACGDPGRLGWVTPSLSTEVGRAGRMASGSAELQINAKAHTCAAFYPCAAKAVLAVPESQPGSVPQP